MFRELGRAGRANGVYPSLVDDKIRRETGQTVISESLLRAIRMGSRRTVIETWTAPNTWATTFHRQGLTPDEAPTNMAARLDTQRCKSQTHDAQTDLDPLSFAPLFHTSRPNLPCAPCPDILPSSARRGGHGIGVAGGTQKGGGGGGLCLCPRSTGLEVFGPVRKL